MKWNVKNLSVGLIYQMAFVALVTAFLSPTICLISCGQSKQATHAIPQVQDPEEKPAQKLDVPPAAGPDPRLPDLSRSVSIDLSDKTDFQGLKSLAGDVLLPLIGDPKISMAYTNGTGTQIQASVLLAFEDKWGFWGASLPSFEGTGTRSTQSLDMTFADDALIVRITGVLSADDLDGMIYYRVRASGDTTCKKSVTTCDIIDPGVNWGPFTCPYPQPDTVKPCLDSMDPKKSTVKLLGKFKAKSSSWAILEGN